MRVITNRSHERGRRVRMARAGAGMTQMQLAQECGRRGHQVNRDTIYRIETGQRDVEVGLLGLIAEITGQPLSWLTAEPALGSDRVIPGYLNCDPVGLVTLDFAA